MRIQLRHDGGGRLGGVIENQNVCVDRRVFNAKTRQIVRLFSGVKLYPVSWEPYVEGRLLGIYRTRRQAVAVLQAYFDKATRKAA